MSLRFIYIQKGKGLKMWLNNEIKILDLKTSIDECIDSMKDSTNVLDINIDFVTAISDLNKIYEIVREDLTGNYDKSRM